MRLPFWDTGAQIAVKALGFKGVGGRLANLSALYRSFISMRIKSPQLMTSIERLYLASDFCLGFNRVVFELAEAHLLFMLRFTSRYKLKKKSMRWSFKNKNQCHLSSS